MGPTLLRLMAGAFVLQLFSCGYHCSAQKLGAEFRADYTLTDLGRVQGLPARQGGLILLNGSTDTLLIGGSANTAKGKLYSVVVTRDDQNSISKLSKAEYYADAPFNDGGLCYAPNGVLLCAQWPVNKLGQLKPGSKRVNHVLNLGPQSEQHSLASFRFFLPTNHLKLLTWRSGRWCDGELRLGNDGNYDLVGVKQVTKLPGGPEGFVYVPKGSAQFTKPSVLVAEFSDGNVVAYEITDQGDPIPSTRRVFVSGLKGAEGGMIDPLTGDFLFTTFGGGDRVIRVDGLQVPTDVGYRKYPKPRVLKFRDADDE